MKTLAARPALWPLLACFLCGSALLAIGLYRWPPGKPGDALKAMAVYLPAGLAFTGGLVLWHRRSPKGYRLGDLWGKRWSGGKALWLLLNLHFVGAAYALLLLVGLGASRS
jgi:hypothetical protein